MRREHLQFEPIGNCLPEHVSALNFIDLNIDSSFNQWHRLTSIIANSKVVMEESNRDEYQKYTASIWM